MAEVEWAHLCDYAFYDEHRKICMIGIFDVINASRVPVIHDRLSIVFAYKGQPHEKVDGMVKIVRPDRGELFASGGEVLLGPRGGATINLNIKSPNLPDFGPYEIQLLVNGKVSKAISFEVIRIQPERPKG